MSYEAAAPLPAAIQKIYSNLGAAPNAYSSSAWLLQGPNAAGGSQFIGMALTPTANAHVIAVRAAIQYNGAGANQVNLSLYSDAGGVPGALLAGPVTVTGLPSYFSCCGLATAVFGSPGVAVTAGTQYWVVGDTPSAGTGGDFAGTWEWVYTPLLIGANVAAGGWFSFPAALQAPAGAVYGTIP
jgi:hypothetical protein